MLESKYGFTYNKFSNDIKFFLYENMYNCNDIEYIINIKEKKKSNVNKKLFNVDDELLYNNSNLSLNNI